MADGGAAAVRVSVPVLPFDWHEVGPEDWQYLGDLVGESEAIELGPDDVAYLSRQLHEVGSVFLACNGELAVATIERVQQVDPLAPVLFNARVRGYPAADPEKPPKPVRRYMPRSLALTEAFEHDAHTHGFSVPSLPYRLRKPALAETAVPITTMFWDLDDPAAHKATGGTLERARPEWRAETWAKIDRLRERHPNPFVYETKRGMRIVFHVDGWTIANDEDAERWEEYVLGCAEYLRREYGIEADPCSRDWVNLFRLPFVRRDGVDQAPVTHGHPALIGAWTYRVTPEDVRERNSNAARASRAKRDRAQYACRDPNAADELIDRAGRAGFLGKEIAPGKYVIRCPNAHAHSSGGGENDTSTVIWRGGALHCSHAHCVDVSRHDLERVLAACDARPVALADVERAVHEAMHGALYGPPVVIVVPPGAGKSRAARSAPTMRLRPAILTDTHALATQTRERLREDHGLDFRHEAGVTAQITGRDLCDFPEDIARIQAAKLPVGKYACAVCPKRGTCTARDPIGGGDGLVSVHQLEARARDAKLLIIDEEPILTDARTIKAATIERALKALSRCDLAFRHAVEAYVLDWHRMLTGEIETPDERARAQADEAELAPGRNLEVKRGKTREPVELGEDGMPLGFGAKVERPAPSSLPISEEWLRDAAALASLRFAARPHAKITRSGENWIVRTLSPAMERLATTARPAAVVLLSATPTLTVLRALVPDLVVVELRVPDGAPISRTLVQVADLQSGKAKIERIRRYVDDALGRARAAGCAAPFVVVAKRFEDEVRVHVGGDVQVAHFGALRGLDSWMGCDAFITVGDHFSERDENTAEALYFGVDAQRLWLERVENELAQVHGRARDPSRTAPAWHWHYGRVWPRGWTHENTDVVPLSKGGRPKTVGASDNGLRDFVRKAGSQKAAAEALGVSPATISRRLAAAG